jgi:hypothetical protein
MLLFLTSCPLWIGSFRRMHCTRMHCTRTHCTRMHWRKLGSPYRENDWPNRSKAARTVNQRVLAWRGCERSPAVPSIRSTFTTSNAEDGSAAVTLLLSWRLKALASMALANRARQMFVPNMSGRALKSATIPTLSLCSSLDTYLPENTVRARLYIIVAFRPSI